MESQIDKTALAARNWRETEKQEIATRNDAVENVKAKRAHHVAKMQLRSAVDALIRTEGTPP